MRKIPEGYEDVVWRDGLRALGSWLDAIAGVVPVLVFAGTAWLAARVILLKEGIVDRVWKGFAGGGKCQWR